MTPDLPPQKLLALSEIDWPVTHPILLPYSLYTSRWWPIQQHRGGIQRSRYTTTDDGQTIIIDTVRRIFSEITSATLTLLLRHIDSVDNGVTNSILRLRAYQTNTRSTNTDKSQVCESIRGIRTCLIRCVCNNTAIFQTRWKTVSHVPDPTCVISQRWRGLYDIRWEIMIHPGPYINRSCCYKICIMAWANILKHYTKYDRLNGSKEDFCIYPVEFKFYLSFINNSLICKIKLSWFYNKPNDKMSKIKRAESLKS